MTGARDPLLARLRPVVVVLLLGAAVVVRFVTTSPLWLDEALSVHIAELPLADIAEALRHDGHPPLYYWLLHGWIELFGSGDDTGVRALSGILGVAALPLVWLAGRRVGGTRTAWAAVLLLAWMPFAVRYSTETRMYSLVALLVLLGHLVVRRAVDERRVSTRSLLAVAAVSGTLLLTQYWSMFLGGAVVAALAWWGRRPGTTRSVAVRLIGAIAAGGLLFVPWVPSFLEQAAHTGTPWATAPRPTVLFDLTLRDLGGGPIAEAGLFAAGVVVLLLLGVLGRSTPSGLVLANRPAPGVRGEAAVIGLTLGLGAVAGLATQSTFASRYSSVILPLIVLVAARGVAVVPGRRAPWLVVAGMVALGAVGVVENVRDHRTQAREIAEAIVANDPAPTIVVACPDQLGPALRRALDQEGLDHTLLFTYPDLGDGRRVDWSDYEERNDSADPVAVAAELLERTSTMPDAPIWVAWNGAYRTFEEDCEAFLNALTVTRGPFRVVQQDGAGVFFEHAGLVVFE